MLPKSSIQIPNKIKITHQPSRTYCMDTTKKRIVGIHDSLGAVKQAAYCILNTERYDYLIYSWNYGIELKNLYGRPVPYVKSEIKRRIKEALLQDDRIHSVEDFSFSNKKGSLTVAFTVQSIAGSFNMTKEADLNV